MQKKKHSMLNLLPLTGFLCADICLHAIQRSNGEASQTEENVLQQWDKEKENYTVAQ
jgi:hypothetical protein